MKQTRLMAIAVACATIATATVVTTHIVHGQSSHRFITRIRLVFCRPISPPRKRGFKRKLQASEKSYLTQWQALTPPVVAGNPPILQYTGYEAQRILGGLLQYDLNISPFENRACASCHMPYVAFSGPIPSVI